MKDKEEKKILLVEDEAVLAMFEKMVLENYGYTVLIAHSGEEAVKMAGADLDIALILMDINLGKGIKGTEAAKRILEGRDVPVIFMSSHTEREVVEMTENITSYGYILKNSGGTVIAASINMAFRLFKAKQIEKEKELALLRKNRALNVLMESYRAIVHTETEKDLLNNICYSLVETGGYSLAWVELADHGDGQSVYPKGPDFTPYKIDLKMRYNSSIVLPLRFDEDVIGSLNVYSSEIDAFDTEEEKLLTQLADDLSYGITVIRGKRRCQNIERKLLQCENR